jgi:hypothetical protein
MVERVALSESVRGGGVRMSGEALSGGLDRAFTAAAGALSPIQQFKQKQWEQEGVTEGVKAAHELRKNIKAGQEQFMNEYDGDLVDASKAYSEGIKPEVKNAIDGVSNNIAKRYLEAQMPNIVANAEMNMLEWQNDQLDKKQANLFNEVNNDNLTEAIEITSRGGNAISTYDALSAALDENSGQIAPLLATRMSEEELTEALTKVDQGNWLKIAETYIESNPTQAKIFVDALVEDRRLNAKDVPSLLKRAENKKAARDQINATMASGMISQYSDMMKNDFYPSEQFKGQMKSLAAGNSSLEARINMLETTENLTKELNAMSIPNLQQFVVQNRNVGLEQGGEKAFFQQRLAEEILDRKMKNYEQDPVTYAQRTMNLDVTPVKGIPQSLNDQESLQSMGERFATTRELPSPLTNQEMDFNYDQYLKASPEQTTSSLQAIGTIDDGRYLEQLSQKNAAMGYAGYYMANGGDLDTAKRIVQGTQNINKNGKSDTGNINQITQVLEELAPGVFDGASKQKISSATEAYMFSRNRSNKVDALTESDEIKESIRKVLGGSPDDRDTAIGKDLNDGDVSYHLPYKVTDDRFTEAVQNFNQKDFHRLSVSGQPPRDDFRGKDIDGSELALESKGIGVYAVKDVAEDKYLTDTNGNQYLFKWDNTLTPR